MKKNIKFCFFLFLIFLCTASVLGQSTGDVDNSSTINIVDALMTAQYSVGYNVAGFNPAVADVDGNGTVNILDALMIAQFSVGTITFFPASPVLNQLDAKYLVIYVPVIDETILAGL